MKKRLLSLVMCLVLAVSLFPAAVYAGEDPDNGIALIREEQDNTVSEEDSPEKTVEEAVPEENRENSAQEDLLPEDLEESAEEGLLPEDPEESAEEDLLPEDWEKSAEEDLQQEDPAEEDHLQDEPEDIGIPVPADTLFEMEEEDVTAVRTAATKDRTMDISLNGRTLSFSATEEDLDYFAISFWRHTRNTPLNITLYRFRYYPAYNDLYLYWAEDGISDYYHADMWVSASGAITKKNGVYRMDPFTFFDQEIVDTTLYWFPAEAVYTDGDHVSGVTDYLYGAEINGIGEPILGYITMNKPNTYPGGNTTCTFNIENVEDTGKLRYQWQQNWGDPDSEDFWENITGATQAVYVPVDEDMGSYLRLTVTAEGYSGVLKSGKTLVLRTLPITSTYFPDSAFRDVLRTAEYDKNQNGYFEGSEISQILKLDLSQANGVMDLTGITYLKALEEIDLSSQPVADVDLPGLANLKKLELSECTGISSLNIQDCTELEHLDLHSTNTGYLHFLDLYFNTKLTYLNLLDSCVQQLDLRNCPNMRSTALYGTITDSAGNPKIPGAAAGYTGDSYFSWNGCELKMNDSPGSGLIVYIATFNSANFPCEGFRKLVQDLCGDSRQTPGILDLSESQSFKYLDYGDTWDKEVTSLDGIQYLPQLQRLYGGDDWNIRYANLNQNTELTELDLGGNVNLTYLNLIENTGLEKVSLRSTGLQSLNLSQNPRIQELDLGGCANLQSIELQTAFASQLKKLDVSRCDLSGTLDVTSRKQLEELYCFDNHIAALDLSVCPNLKKLHCYENSLTVVNISQNPNLLAAYNNGTGEKKTDRFGFEYLDYSYKGYELFVSPATRIRTTPEEMTISLNKYTADLATTKTLQLTATIKPASAAGQTITWKSSDTGIATVSSKGLVKAKKYGKVTITASAGGKKAVCTIQTRFNDVNDPGKSYYKPVYWAVDKGITKCSVTFRPNDGVTRGEFVAFLYRYAGSPSVSDYVTKFTDVNSGTKFYKEISWAVNKGIIKGFSDKTFRPEDTLTREQCAIMIWRYAGRPAPRTAKSPFSDVKKSGADSYKAILWGAENGIIKGSKGKFLPKDLCTRANVVTFLYRYDDL